MLLKGCSVNQHHLHDTGAYSKQNFRPYHRSAESQATFYQDPQGICIHNVRHVEV